MKTTMKTIPSVNHPLWLIGAGPMALAYARVLQALSVPFTVIGRGESSAGSFEKETGVPVVRGERFPDLPDYRSVRVICATNIDTLVPISRRLLDLGVGRLLLEKPGALAPAELREFSKFAEGRGTDIFVGYNRRFYASAVAARELIASDGGPSSFVFEFTELADRIATLNKPLEISRNWLFANSSHVIDLAFFLGGFPQEINANVAGSLSWHPEGSVFTGSGTTEAGVPFSYHADWTSGGRWGVTVCTRKRRMILQPLESLHEQLRGTFEVRRVELVDEYDRQFKPGLFRQVESFLSDRPGLPTIASHASHLWVYDVILRGGSGQPS